MSGSSTTTDTLQFTAEGVSFDLVLTVEGTDGTGAVTAISGTVNGQAVTQLETAYGADNEVTTTTEPYVDGNGITFLTADGTEYNVYSDNGQLYVAPPTDDSNPASDVTMTITCFMAGTAIATPDGDRAVETLAIGDVVHTAGGGAASVRWIGRRTLTGHGKTDLNGNRFVDLLPVLPIRIRAGALGDNLPVRDLLLSPCHAIRMDGILIQAGALVNGNSILRETDPSETFTYYHIELEAHALVRAEGVAAETFVDNVTRMGFDNWAEYQALFPSDQPTAEMDLPRAQSRRQVPDHILHRIETRAALLFSGKKAAA